MEKELTEKEQEFLRNLFWKNNAYSSEKLDKQINEDLYILGKYKGDLARAYEKVGEQRNTLIFIMQEISDKQDSIVLHMNALETMFIRLENMFFDKQEKTAKNKNPILDKPIEFLDLNKRVLNCLKGENIKNIDELINYTKRKIKIIPNLGKVSLSDIEYQLEQHGLKIKE